ncbi:twin-arginine translocation signal domain-containing protein [Haloferax sp. MBLA0077]|uniref:Twin-arginine translocation signal domain-containing protein n=2 Tax=Haloferax TaxID=2251 RepID=A0A6G1Z187_9EURY|nr:twin-arginine translocation signal domain-containing protein [Haloferax sp. CBA1149]MRW80407.1 twin-arginine translocation signal domain-containing protein [Haloferax marinisediminis]
MTGTPAFDRRAFLKPSTTAGITGVAGLTTATPGRTPGPKENEVLVGVSKTAGSPRQVVEQQVPTNVRVVHENETLGGAAVAFAERNATHSALYTTNDAQRRVPVVVDR